MFREGWSEREEKFVFPEGRSTFDLGILEIRRASMEQKKKEESEENESQSLSEPCGGTLKPEIYGGLVSPHDAAKGIASYGTGTHDPF